MLVDFGESAGGATAVTKGPKGRGSSNKETSLISQLFQKLRGDLEAGETATVREGLGVLEQALKPTSGMRKRDGGGVEYRALFVLDSVLLADNLRSLSYDTGENDESNLLDTVVRQP